LAPPGPVFSSFTACVRFFFLLVFAILSFIPFLPPRLSAAAAAAALRAVLESERFTNRVSLLPSALARSCVN